MAESFARALARSDSIRDRSPGSTGRHSVSRTSACGAATGTRAGGGGVGSTGARWIDRRAPAPLAEPAPAIVLRHVVDLEVSEIARRMGTAAPTVRVHLHRGRKRLRDLLGAEEVDDA